MEESSSEILLRVENLSQEFGKTKAVDDISFAIRKGEVLGLVGESGCGKTTTGRSIIGIYPVTSGKIFFKGEQIAGHFGASYRGWKGRAQRRQAQKLRNKIQMIFQDPVASLNPRMTVGDIIAEGLVIGGMRDRAQISSRVYEMLELVGLRREHAGRYPHEFSGGQRQRIGIARALIMKPELLIADEPVSALDVSIQAQVINLLGDLREKLGLTMLFIAHDLSVVKYVSHRIGVMHQGKLVELADADVLFSKPLHPYTKALLSAIPLPDPYLERQRQRLHYDPETAHDYADQKPTWRQVGLGHFLYCNDREEKEWLV